MTWLRRLPIRARLSLGFAVAMVVLFAGVAFGLYTSMANALLDEVDTGLRFRAATVVADVPVQERSSARPPSELVESNESFLQIVEPNGSVVRSTVSNASLLRVSELHALDEPTFFTRRVAGVENVGRLLAVPAMSGTQRLVVVVGASLSDRADAMKQLLVYLVIAAPVALVLACGAGWLLAGAALRPVERLRGQASAISLSGLDRRLSEPSANDEIGRLARTLNEMLDRLRESFETERRFLDNASHELRTPLSALKMELDLARARPRTSEELRRALDSASEETDRLARLAEDLLVLSRARGGKLSVHREPTSLREVVSTTARRFDAAAASAGISIVATAPDESVSIDATRATQAIGDLLDNAIRHSSRGGIVRVDGSVVNGIVSIVVEDSGEGFTPKLLTRALEPFAEGSSNNGAGLGLAIVRAIAEGHGGTAVAENRPGGGARVTFTLGC
jgi:two-component system OmpR family sensor kinase